MESFDEIQCEEYYLDEQNNTELERVTYGTFDERGITEEEGSDNSRIERKTF
jgi:hypothetical protein